MSSERKVWRTVSVSADPFNEGCMYAVQELRGTFRDTRDGEVWTRASSPAATRVIYLEMTEGSSVRAIEPPFAGAR